MDTPSADDLVFDPSTMPEHAFLAGPERDEADLDVDRIFAKDFHVVLSEQEAFFPGSTRLLDTSVVTDSVLVPGYRFVDVDCGTLLLDVDGRVCGGYIGCDLAIAPEHQGLGLGSELVLEHAMRQGSLPTWFLDVPAYSPAGQAAHRAAHRLALRRDVFERKRQNLLDALAPAGPAP